MLTDWLLCCILSRSQDLFPSIGYYHNVLTCFFLVLSPINRACFAYILLTIFLFDLIFRRIYYFSFHFMKPLAFFSNVALHRRPFVL